jgi:L-threonylcarbamoyladenylate synthase
MRSLWATDENACRAAAAALLAGEMVLLPTDTVYGLAAIPDNPEAVRRIYQAKNRPDGLHLPVLAASVDQVHELGVEFSEAAATLSSRWWPGPLTLAFGFSATKERPRWLADREEVAVRIPRIDFLLELLNITGVLVVTSANRHGEMTPPSAQEAGAHVAPHPSLVIDAGTLDSVPSTLVNVRAHPAVVEREGSISGVAIASALGIPA